MKDDYFWIQDRIQSLDRELDEARYHIEDNKPILAYNCVKRAKRIIEGFLQDLQKDD